MTTGAKFSACLAILAADVFATGVIVDLPASPARDVGLVLVGAAWAVFFGVALRILARPSRGTVDNSPACTNCGARGVELVAGFTCDPARPVCLPCLYPRGF